jgi:hypothetical protein
MPKRSTIKPAPPSVIIGEYYSTGGWRPTAIAGPSKQHVLRAMIPLRQLGYRVRVATYVRAAARDQATTE